MQIPAFVYSFIFLVFFYQFIAATEINFDRKERFGKLPNYRTSTTPFKIKRSDPPSREGLDSLRISASGQPTEKELLEIRNQVESKYRFILVDLRSERHGYLNGEPILWKSAEKEPSELFSKDPLKIEDRSKNTYEILPVVFVTEEALAKSHDIETILFPTKDGQEPSEEVINSFIAFASNLPENSWLHLHCREGWSRTTLYFAMFDMLQNADALTFKTIIRRQHLIGGGNMASEPELSIQYNFLRRFYDYAKIRKNGYRGNWTDYCNNCPPEKIDYYLRAIEGPLEEFEKQDFPEILSQDFYYQGQGCSTVAFRSADNQFILKLFKLRDTKTGKEILKRFQGYQIAMELNPEKTGMIYYHLHQSNHLKAKPRIFEKNILDGKVVYTPMRSVDLNNTIFAIQKKAINFGNLIAGDIRKNNKVALRNHLRGIFELYNQDLQKGFWDIDCKFIYNTGYIGDTAIRYDVSHLRELSDLPPEFSLKFKREVLKHFVLWIQRKNFEDVPEIFEELLYWLIKLQTQKI